MARAHFAENVLGVSGSGTLSLMAGATVHVYDEGTTTPIAQTIYDADSGVGTLSNPLTSDANGKVEFWLATAARVDLAVSKTGFTSQTRTVDVEDAPGGGGGGGGSTLTQLLTASADGVATSWSVSVPSGVSRVFVYADFRVTIPSGHGAVALQFNDDTTVANYVGIQNDGGLAGVQAHDIGAGSGDNRGAFSFEAILSPRASGGVTVRGAGWDAPGSGGPDTSADDSANGGWLSDATVTSVTLVVVFGASGTYTPMAPTSGGIEVWVLSAS